MGQSGGPEPRVGIGVVVRRGGKVLVGQRLGSNGAGTYALPGGHLEFGESWAACAARELKEETGLDLLEAKFAHVNNNVMSATHHYITIFLVGEVPPGAEPVTCEPDKCAGWSWVDWPSGVPEPVFLPLRQLIAAGYDPATNAPAAGC